jgi:hypothetical protein
VDADLHPRLLRLALRTLVRLLPDHRPRELDL